MRFLQDLNTVIVTREIDQVFEKIFVEEANFLFWSNYKYNYI